MGDVTLFLRSSRAYPLAMDAITLTQALIFLDIDGVLNSDRYLATLSTQSRLVDPADDAYWLEMIDPTAVERLNKLTRLTGAKLVISSAWRTYLGMSRLVPILAGRGVEAEVIDQTPENSDWTRSAEIKCWLSEHPSHGPWVAIDDLELTGLRYAVRTNGREGLQGKHVLRAARLLKEQGASISLRQG